jgi:starch-binding outer membrane protein, SusD/RagB family
MKTKIYIGCLLAASLLATTTSCSDFLNEDPKGQLAQDNFFTCQADLDASVNTLYEKANQTQSWTNPMYPQWQGDDMTANPGSNKQAVAALDGFSSDGANKGVTGAWDQHYKLIKAANFVIEGAGRTPVSQTEINIALGNAYYWRAYAYFYLVRIFGPLPLVTSTDVSAQDCELTSVEDIYKFIVDDLTKAESMLPTSYSASPRNHDGVDAWITKQATQATLAAVYMAMAGYPLNKGTEYYALAAAKAKEVIDKNSEYGFYLDDTWSHVYSIAHNYNKETLVGIDNNWNNGSWDHDSELTSCNRFEGLGDGGWGDSWGEIAFWKRFPEGPRKDAIYAPKVTFQSGTTITKICNWWDLYKEDQYDDNGNITAHAGDAVVAAYHPMFSIYTTNCDPTNSNKELVQPYNYLEPNYTNMTDGRRHRLIRYSEVLLWYAESAARSGGDISKGKEYLKQVRKRAVNDYENVTLSDGTTVKIDNMTADQLAEACYIEHGWEVAGQWTQMVTRRADELRMNELKKNFDYRVANAPIVVHVDEDGTQYTAKESVSVVNSTWAGDESIYCPYPTTEVEKNPNLHR